MSSEPETTKLAVLGDVGPVLVANQMREKAFVRAICDWHSDRMSAAIGQNAGISTAAHRNRISEPPCQESLRRLIQTQSLKLADRLFARLHLIFIRSLKEK